MVQHLIYTLLNVDKNVGKRKKKERAKIILTIMGRRHVAIFVLFLENVSIQM